jgi:hypothetical protein
VNIVTFAKCDHGSIVDDNLDHCALFAIEQRGKVRAVFVFEKGQAVTGVPFGEMRFRAVDSISQLGDLK